MLDGKHLFLGMRNLARLLFLLILLNTLASCGLFRKVHQTSTSSGKEQKWVQEALAYLGKPYCNGGQDTKCFDCSGLVWRACKSVGCEVPRTCEALYAFGKPLQRNAVKPGDLVFFNTSAKGGKKANHVGIVTHTGENLRFVHASSSKGVMENTLADTYYRNALLGFMRLPCAE
jgi:cell wall-associated NlpC family hydrolase